MQNQTHEQYSRSGTEAPGSERAFGLVMAGAFAILAALNLWHRGAHWPWLTALAAGFLLLAWFRPATLKPLNRLWFRFGLLLHRIISPVILALLFFSTFLPVGLVMRAFGKDFLRLRREPGSDSYWIKRQPAGPAPETMKDQF
jgi:hypothetical protein